MSTITKFNISRENFSEYLYSTHEGSDNIISTDGNEFTHVLEITDTILQYRLTRKKMGEETEDIILHDFELDINSIRNHNLFTDQCYFTLNRKTFDVGVSQPSERAEVAPRSAHSVAFTIDLLSLFDKTYAVRPSPLTIAGIAADAPYMFPIRIFVPHVGATFNECTFHVLTTNESFKTIDTPDNIVPVINSDIWNISVDTTKHAVIDSATSYKTFLAPIASTTTVTSPSVGDVIPVTVTCADTSISKLYLDQVVGVLDKTQVNLTNGVGTFSILTNTLSAGETVKVKIGYKKYTNVNTFTKILA